MPQPKISLATFSRCNRTALMAAAAVLLMPVAPASAAGKKTGKAAAARLFYLDTATPGRCLWQVRDLASDASRQVFETKECPREIVWDAASKKLVFYTSNKLVTWAWDKPGAKATMVELPPHKAFADFWIDEKSGNPMLAAFVPPEKLQQVDGETRLVFEGKAYAYDADDTLPPDGEPGLAIAYQYKGKEWQRVVVEPTRGSEEDPIGMMVLGDELEPRRQTASLRQLLQAQSCGVGNPCGIEKLKASTAVLNKLSSTFRVDEGTGEGPAFDPLDGNSGMLFQLTMGDTLHRTPPAFMCQAGCSKQLKLEELPGGEQYGLAVKGKYALVTREYSGEDARIYRAGSAKPVLSLPSSQGAIWLPDGIF